MREMQAPPRGLLVVRRLAVAALGCGRPYRCMRAWPGRVLALPSVRRSRPSSDVPIIVEYPVMPPPQILAFGWGGVRCLEPPRGAPGRDGASGVSAPGPPRAGRRRWR
jgi:hypothetical protein